MLWVWGTWWIPFLVIVGVWKIFVFKDPIQYSPALWSIVFPLGMYTVATDQVSQFPGLYFFHTLVPWFMYIALLAWCLVSLSLLVTLLLRAIDGRV
ncbi:hypothetical protein LLE49_12315 [Alicyclobacillus tolerans]|uniref:hypothetical protein n=1 Tax=Alicyclobacillus tolerans TaxID=90970 RepID=UPI001F1DAA92|nr:hypothetical protein [Alicyclobacillus tolerans]MCF8565500.1 hypothetical protein [Alicyclobacillus tolerans]